MSGVVLGSPAALGAAVGALGGLGLWLVIVRLAARRPTLDSRLAPYLRTSPSRSSLLATTVVRSPFPTVERLLAPAMRDAVRVAERLGSPAADVRRRLMRAGRSQTVEQFRAEQVVWTVVAAAAGLGLALLLVATRGTGTVAGTALVVVAALTGLAAHDQVLALQVRRRERLLLAELPTVAELLALAVTAGEGALGGLERIVRTARGALSAEIRTVVDDARAGTSLPVALDRLADRTGLVPLARFCEAVSVAVERGTPLAEVLRAQAQDAREAGRRELMESGGRKEVAMMVPVVFLILPITVVFAVFPGLLALRIDL